MLRRLSSLALLGVILSIMPFPWISVNWSLNRGRLLVTSTKLHAIELSDLLAAVCFRGAIWFCSVVLLITFEQAVRYRYFVQPKFPLVLSGQDSSARSLLYAAVGLWTWWLRCLPNCMLIGEAKCGTTFLHMILSQHPNFKINHGQSHYFLCRSWLGTLFERFSFLDRIIYASFNPDIFSRFWLEKVVSLGRQQIIDATPTLRFPALAHRLASAACPKAKLIVCLREPVERAYSHYRMCCAQVGCEGRTFEEACIQELEREEGGFYDSLDARCEREKSLRSIVDGNPEEALQYLDKRYLRAGCYADHLEAFEVAFGEERMMILSFSELVKGPVHTANKVLRFLDLPEFSPEQLRGLDVTPRMVGVGAKDARGNNDNGNGNGNGNGHVHGENKGGNGLYAASDGGNHAHSVLTRKTSRSLKSFFASSNARIQKKYGIILSS